MENRICRSKAPETLADLHAWRRRMIVQELKEYLSPPKGQGVWAVIGGQPAEQPGPRLTFGKVLQLRRRRRGKK